jgi:hypothetical protein
MAAGRPGRSRRRQAGDQRIEAGAGVERGTALFQQCGGRGRAVGELGGQIAQGVQRGQVTLAHSITFGTR